MLKWCLNLKTIHAFLIFTFIGVKIYKDEYFWLNVGDTKFNVLLSYEKYDIYSKCFITTEN